MPVRILEQAAPMQSTRRVRVLEEGAASKPERTSQAQGFIEGAYNVAGNLAPVLNAFSPGTGDALRRQADATKQAVAQREAQGVKSGEGGKFWGGLAASAPTMFMGGPALSGAIQGYSTSEADNVGGKLVDAGIGAVGGKIGSAVIGKVANAVAPRITPAARRIMGEGIELTPGQMRGGAAMVREDKLMSKPFVGQAIAEDRIKGMADFTIAGANKALAPLGVKVPAGVKPGHDAVNFAHDQVTAAYNRVVPKMAVKPDAPFVAGLTAMAPDVAKLPAVQRKQFDAVTKGIKANLSGRALQDALSDVRKMSADYSTSAVASERQLGRALRKLGTELDDMMVRQNPKYAPDFKKANAAFRGLAVVEDAAGRADDGLYSTGQLKQAVRRGDRSARKSDSAMNKAYMQEFSNDARAVLPAKTPDSGTAGRQNHGKWVANAFGAAQVLGYKASKATSRAIAKADPRLVSGVRNAFDALQRPVGYLTAAGATQASK